MISEKENSILPTQNLEQKEIIFNFLRQSHAIDSSTTFSDWEELLKEDKLFDYKYRNLLNVIESYFAIIESNNIMAIMKILLKEEKWIAEVLNVFFTVNNILNHFKYYNNQLEEYDFNQRTYDENSTERYFNFYQNRNFVPLLRNYKTKPLITSTLYKIDELEQNFYFNNSDEMRRKIYLDDQGFFNYICYKCPFITHSSEIDVGCPFSHNKYEILYHPLNLKTKFCKEKVCSHKDCPFSHDEKLDFRILYNKNNVLIRKIIRICFTSQIFCEDRANKGKIGDLINLVVVLPSEFNPETYKTIECPLGNHCRLDRKLCLNYHDLKEKRRDFRKISYKPIVCANVYKDNKFIDTRNCPNGDSCTNFHNIYELLYCKENFRQRVCQYEKNNKECEYLIICPYRHISDEIDFENKIIYNKEACNYYTENLKDTIKEQFKKINSLQKVVNCHLCSICSNDLKGHYNKLTCCNKIICETCKLAPDNQNCKFCNQSFIDCPIKEIKVKLNN